MLNPVRVEIALFGKIGNAAKAACFLISGAGNFNRAGIVRVAGDKRLGRDD